MASFLYVSEDQPAASRVIGFMEDCLSLMVDVSTAEDVRFLKDITLSKVASSCSSRELRPSAVDAGGSRISGSK